MAHGRAEPGAFELGGPKLVVGLERRSVSTRSPYRSDPARVGRALRPHVEHAPRTARLPDTRPPGPGGTRPRAALTVQRRRRPLPLDQHSRAPAPPGSPPGARARLPTSPAAPRQPAARWNSALARVIAARRSVARRRSARVGGSSRSARIRRRPHRVVGQWAASHPSAASRLRLGARRRSGADDDDLPASPAERARPLKQGARSALGADYRVEPRRSAHSREHGQERTGRSGGSSSGEVTSSTARDRHGCPRSARRGSRHARRTQRGVRGGDRHVASPRAPPPCGSAPPGAGASPGAHRGRPRTPRRGPSCSPPEEDHAPRANRSGYSGSRRRGRYVASRAAAPWSGSALGCSRGS
jgi:hypothetical protein